MPMPVSLTQIITSSACRSAVNRILPLSGVNLTAFDSRLNKICFNFRSSASIVKSFTSGEKWEVKMRCFLTSFPRNVAKL